MAPARSTASFVRFISLAGFLAFATLGLRDDDRARACGWYGPSSIAELTTFDDTILGDGDGLYYDPFTPLFGDGCSDCAQKAMLADWQGYLKDTISPADWQKVLEGPSADVTAQRKRAKGNLRAALAVIELAKQVEPNATLSGDAPPAPELLAQAQLGLKSARDPFIAQRYAYQALRVLFYQRNWKGAVTFFDQNLGKLEQPSADLGWRAHHYAAGALRRIGNNARANLELARIHASYPPLAAEATSELSPGEDAEWRDTLKLAKTPREKALLWRVVGIKQDGLAAAQEIVKIDPKSNLIALLVVRELARAESRISPAWIEGGSEPDELAAAEKSFKAIEAIAGKLAATPGADRPWLWELVLGHIAAKHGDLASARTHLQKAVAAKSDDPRIRSQAQASLALALAHDYKIEPKREAELAAAMNSLDPSFGRLATVDNEVRTTLAGTYAKAGRTIDAEFLAPGTAKTPWDAKLIQQLIARSQQLATPFDQFVVTRSGHNATELADELAKRFLVEGRFADAVKTYGPKASTDRLGTDPFVIHTVDCHDCDHEKYANAPWTLLSVYEKLAALDKTAHGKGDHAAEAAFEIGNALYNATWYGNARVILDASHQDKYDTRAAERYYKRAFDLAQSRELKARAAFMAAKAEQAQLLADNDSSLIPPAKRWFPVVKTLKDTKYYKEILRECSVYRGWAGQ